MTISELMAGVTPETGIREGLPMRTTMCWRWIFPARLKMWANIWWPLTA